VVPPKYGAAGDLAVGAFAQLTAGFVFTPVDIIKERMQVPSPPTFSPDHSSGYFLYLLINGEVLAGWPFSMASTIANSRSV